MILLYRERSTRGDYRSFYVFFLYRFQRSDDSSSYFCHIFVKETRTAMRKDKSSGVSDETLLLQIRQGCRKSFDMLFIKYYPVLCAYTRQFLEPEDGEEVVQDVMVWLWENRHRVTFEASLRNYLFRAVRNRCLSLIDRNELKRKAYHIVHEKMSSHFENPDFYDYEELTRRIEEALAHLPESYREAFELNRFHRFTYKEIAERLKVSPKTVDYRIQQALKQLRIELKDLLPILFLGL